MFAIGPAAAQFSAGKAEIWKLEIGTPVTELPATFFDPHCGTNGGPPSIALGSWDEYARCPPDRETGLHEVWFTEDDESEYVALAYRSQQFGPGPSSANVLLNHKVIYSVLIDGDGLLQGYRVFTDVREPEVYRYDGHGLGESLRILYGFSDFECIDLPRLDGENAVDGVYVKQDCVAVVDGRHITIERRFFRKPGQMIFDPLSGARTVGYYESTTAMEVINVDLVSDAEAN